MVIVSLGPKVRGIAAVLPSSASASECDSGRKFSETTALGMTETISGSSEARRTVFSLQVCETQIMWSTSLKVNLRSLLVRILAASANPKSEWSVKTVRKPMVRAWRIAS
jgi:hypothetical protein